MAAELLDGYDLLIAPDLALIEVTNALWRKIRVGEVTPLQVNKAIEEMGAILTLWPVTAEMTRLAFEIAQKIGHSMYDCMFLACAMQEEAQLITADVKFAEKIKHTDFSIKVRQLSPA